MLLSIQGALLRDTVLGIVRAVQFQLAPLTLSSNREGFDRALTFVLSVRSLGTYYHWSDHEIDTWLEEKWQELQLKAD